MFLYAIPTLTPSIVRCNNSSCKLICTTVPCKWICHLLRRFFLVKEYVLKRCDNWVTIGEYNYFNLRQNGIPFLPRSQTSLIGELRKIHQDEVTCVLCDYRIPKDPLWKKWITLWVTTVNTDHKRRVHLILAVRDLTPRHCPRIDF